MKLQHDSPLVGYMNTGDVQKFDYSVPRHAWLTA